MSLWNIDGESVYCSGGILKGRVCIVAGKHEQEVHMCILSSGTLTGKVCILSSGTLTGRVCILSSGTLIGRVCIAAVEYYQGVCVVAVEF